MTLPRGEATTPLFLEQGRILEALADDDAVLTGTVDDVGRQFGLGPDDLRLCLRELLDAGWIAVTLEASEHLEIRLERRPRSELPPVTGGTSAPRHRLPATVTPRRQSYGALWCVCDAVPTRRREVF